MTLPFITSPGQNRKIGDCVRSRKIEPDAKISTNAPERIAGRTEERVVSYARFLQSPSLIQDLNDSISTQFHGRESATALCNYYRNKPKLKSLTLSKEVSRLDYEFKLEGGRKIRESEDIKSFFDEYECDDAEELILRASNQTLMADLLTVLMGDGGIVKRQFLATAVAERCHFFINMETSSRYERKDVLGVCDFVISIPGGEDGKSRLNLATVRASAFLSPGTAMDTEPLLRYRIHSVKPHLQSERDSQVIKTAAAWLATHLHHEENNTHHAPTKEISTPATHENSSSTTGFHVPFMKPSFGLASKMQLVIDAVATFNRLDQEYVAA